MKRKLLFVPNGKRWNRLLRQFVKLYRRIINGSYNYGELASLLGKLNSLYKKLEKMQHSVGIKLAGTAIAAMLIAVSTQAQTFVKAPNLKFARQNVDIGSFSSPAFADIDGDGDLDIYSGGEGGYVYVFVNDGNNNFAKSDTLKVSGSNINVVDFSSPVFADIDKDGDLDLYVGNYDRIYTYLNDGKGNFSAGGKLQADGSDIEAGNNAVPRFADLDKDGDLDLYVGYKYVGIKIFRNDGGSFTADGNLQAGGSGIYIRQGAPSFADIDGDGDLDLYVGGQDGQVHTYVNDNGAFTASGKLEADGSTVDVGYNAIPAFADLDGDGDDDMFIGEEGGYINVLSNDGGSFASAGMLQYGDGTIVYGEINVGHDSTPAFADIDGDGDLDLYVGDDRYGNINVFRKEVTGFEPLGKLEANNGYISTYYGKSEPAFADIDEDGDLDLYVGAYYGRIYVYNNDAGKFTSSGKLEADGSNIYVGFDSSPAFADTDGDGDLDLYVGDDHGFINVFTNDAGTFTVSGRLMAGGSDIDVGIDSSPAFADLDGDGDLDLYVGDKYGFINVYRNDGGSFVKKGKLQADGSEIDVGAHSSPVFADLDGDGDLDLYVGNNDGTISVFINEGGANGIAEHGPAVDNIAVYPNPTTGVLDITNLNGASDLTLTDMSGKTIKHQLVSAEQVMLDISGYPAGVYILKVRFDDLVKTVKVMKK